MKTSMIKTSAEQCRRLTFNSSYLFAILLLLLVSGNLIAQQSGQLIKGVVRDQQSGDPLPGVKVKEVGKDNLTSTDGQGQFSIWMDKLNGSLQFSYIGYISETETLTNSQPLSITLKPDMTSLEQVVVVGFGKMKKSSVTGAIVQISGDELKTAPTANLSSMLQGRLPGLVTRQTTGQPGSDGASLMVRGYNTLGNNNPLIIVDGIEREFPQINPEEVESISVLKDASAAIYGVRGANGVILVTTKRGSNQKPTITYDGSLSLSKNTAFPEFLNGPEYAHYYNKAQELDGIAETARRFSQDDLDRITNGDPKGVYGNTNWFDLLFKDTAPIKTHNLSVNGGTDRYKFFVSLGAYDQEGIIDRTSYNRYNGRINLDAKIVDNFSVEVNAAIKDDMRQEPGLSAGIGNSYASIFSQAMMSYPYLNPYTETGIPIGSFNANNGNQNPLAARDLSGEQTNRSTRFQSNIALRYDLPYISGLSLKVNLAIDKGYSMRKSELLPYQLNVFSNADKTFNIANARHALSGDAVINQWFADSWSKTLQPSISYANNFGKHNISSLLLYEYLRIDNTSLSGGRRSFPIEDIMDLNFGDVVIDDLVKGGHGMFRRAGYSFRFNYDYADKYLVELVGRYDGSPQLPAHSRWDIFPALLLGWRISNESFFKSDVIDDLKLRASVGKLGNDRIGDYRYLRTMTPGANPVVMIGNNLKRPLNVTVVPNPDIRWETTNTYNLGLESSLWNGKLGIEGDVFYRVTKDILQGQGGVMPPSFGGYFPEVVNSGVVDSRGFEAILTHRNHVGDFRYNVRGNISWARSKVIETTEDVNVPDHLRKAGRPIGLKYGFVADGFFKDQADIDHSALFAPAQVGEVKLKDLNGDGRITWDQDWTVIGKADLPEMMFGLNVGGDYKGFDFNMFFQGAARTDVALAGIYTNSGVYDNTFYTMPFYQDGNSPKYLVENAWTPDNPNAKYPRLSTRSAQSGGKFSSFWINDGSYLRLKSAQVGYTVPNRLTEKLNIQRIRLYASGSNLFTWSKLEYLDPEMPSVNQGYYPQQRLYEFGLNVTF